jgi:hypothetical protein
MTGNFLNYKQLERINSMPSSRNELLQDQQTDEQKNDLEVASNHIKNIRDLVNNYLTENGSGMVIRNIELGRDNKDTALRHVLVCKCTDIIDFCYWEDNH